MPAGFLLIVQIIAVVEFLIIKLPMILFTSYLQLQKVSLIQTRCHIMDQLFCLEPPMGLMEIV